MATRLSYFAFFRELGFHVGNTVSAEEIERAPCPDRAAAAAYLRAGSPMVVVPGYVEDPLAEPGTMIFSGGSVLTDGEWIWPQIAADFVQMHGVTVPSEFLRHMRDADFAVRPLSLEEVREVFALAGESLSVEPLEEMSPISIGPRLVILDIRQVGDRFIDCVVRSDGPSIYEGHEVRAVGSDDTNTDLIKVETIIGRDGRLSHLATGQSARVTLTGAHVAQLNVGTVLVAQLG